MLLCCRLEPKMSYTVLCMSTFSKQALHKNDWNEAALGLEHYKLFWRGCKVQTKCPLHVTLGGQG